MQPTSGDLRWRAVDVEPEQPVKKTRGQRVFLVWRQKGLEALKFEAGVPPDHAWGSWIEVSGGEDWSSIANWAKRLFETDAADVDVANWFGEAVKAEEMSAERIVDFVQQEIRYLSLSLGENSHRPRPANEVMSSRYGDCKDKSILLVTALRSIGMKVDPVLVRSVGGSVLSEALPMRVHFNHVIVRAVIEGRTVFIDATNPFQRGTLQERPHMRFRWGLVAAEGQTGLVPITPAFAHEQRIEYDRTFTLKDGEIWEESSAQYFGTGAEYARAVLTGNPQFFEEGLERLVTSRNLQGKATAKFEETPEGSIQLNYRVPLASKDKPLIVASLDMVQIVRRLEAGERPRSIVHPATYRFR